MVVMVVVSDYLKKLLWVDLNRASYQTQGPPPNYWLTCS